MKAADQHTLSENVAVDGFEHVCPSGVRPQVELRIQGEELEGLVVMRARGGRSRSQVADSPALVLRLHRTVGQPSDGGHSFREPARSARNGKWWKAGFIASLANIAIWSTIGFGWWKLIGLW